MLSVYKVTDSQYSSDVVAENTIEALVEFVLYHQGGVIYKRDCTIEYSHQAQVGRKKGVIHNHI